jgi:hypothetical protein
MAPTAALTAGQAECDVVTVGSCGPEEAVVSVGPGVRGCGVRGCGVRGCGVRGCDSEVDGVAVPVVDGDAAAGTAGAVDVVTAGVRGRDSEDGGVAGPVVDGGAAAGTTDAVASGGAATVATTQDDLEETKLSPTAGEGVVTGTDAGTAVCGGAGTVTGLVAATGVVATTGAGTVTGLVAATGVVPAAGFVPTAGAAGAAGAAGWFTVGGAAGAEVGTALVAAATSSARAGPAIPAANAHSPTRRAAPASTR